MPASDEPKETEIKNENSVLEKQEPKKQKKKRKWADKAIDIEDGPYDPLSNPIDDTNCFSLLSYWWVSSLLSKGFKRPINVRIFMD